MFGLNIRGYFITNKWVLFKPIANMNFRHSSASGGVCFSKSMESLTNVT